MKAPLFALLACLLLVVAAFMLGRWTNSPHGPQTAPVGWRHGVVFQLRQHR